MGKEIKSTLFRIFGKLYFLKRKEEGKVINDFLKWKNNSLFDDFFAKAKKISSLKGLISFGESDAHKKKLFYLFKYAVSIVSSI